jgi:hypothetical protein
MGKKKAGKTEESKKEDDQRPGSTRSGVNYQPRTSAERGAAIFTKGHLNPPTHQLTHRHFWASGGSHPLFIRDPDCAADGMSTAAQEMKGGLSWELAVAKAESATAVAATTKADAAIKTMAANAPTDPQTLQGFRGIAPFVTGTTVTCDPECAADGTSTAAQEMKGGLSWELAVSGLLPSLDYWLSR